MKNDDQKKSPKLPLNRDADHPLRTRRDFLAQGLLAGVGTAILPFAAQANSCDFSMTVTDNPMIPTIVIDLAGGSNIAGSHVIVGKEGGQFDFLADYTTLGLDAGRHPRLTGMINTELGLAFHRDSNILAGIKSVTDTVMRSKIDGVLFCAASDDDTDNNPHNPMYWIHKAGARGKLTQLLGNQISISGARAQAPAISVELKNRPTYIGHPSQVANLIGVGSTAESFMGPSRTGMLMRAIDSLNSAHLNSISRRKLTDSIRDVVMCNSAKTQALLHKFTTNEINPYTDSTITSLFDFNNDFHANAAGIVKLVLDGYAATGTITLGGFDYHTGNRFEGDNVDQRLGDLMGRIFHAAALKATPVIIYVYTDGGIHANGSVDPTNGKLAWTGDSSQRSATLMMVYNPGGRNFIRNNKRQIGAYKDDGSVNLVTSPLSNSVLNLSRAVMLNFLALHGQEGNFSNVVDENPFGSLDSHIAFSRIA